MTICPHTIRVIEDWAGKKNSPQRGQSVMVKAKTEVIKDDGEDAPFNKKKT
jgi:hypothetical protein